MNIKFSSEYQGAERWQWCVWLDLTPEEAASVDGVVYHLDPTFALPLRKQTNASENFRICAEAYGTFRVNCVVTLAGGHVKRLTRKVIMRYPNGMIAE
jgi:transcription initiation factor IIF auxiliary subunit